MNSGVVTQVSDNVVGTPAMDLLNKGCHLCDNWPCINACDTGALKLPEDDEAGEIIVQQFAKASIDTSKCWLYAGPECGACAYSCKIDGALIWECEKPSIVTEKCVGCGLCREACIVEGKAINIRSIHAQVVIITT